MGTFCDLHQLGIQLKEKYNNLVFQDGMKLPSEITRLNSFDNDGKLVFHKYSFESINRQGQKIYLPNYLVYVAAYFVDYYKELNKYYTFFSSIGLTSEQETKCESNEEYIDSLLKDKQLDDDDYKFAKQFLKDPKWWYGGKSITRSSDYFYSPILSMAGLVAAAQGFVPTITKFLSDHPDLVKLLIDRVSNNSIKRELIYETGTLAEFMEKAMNIILKYDPELKKIIGIKENINTIGFVNCQIGKLASVSDIITDNRRTGDVNKELQWEYNNKQYYFFKEQTKDSVSIFINEMNNAYNGVFFLELDNNIYKFYKLSRANMIPDQRIYFGTPGSGKSKKVERDVLPDDENLVFRTTFHPDTDYSSFVGCYKPVMNGGKVSYEFSPQVFTDAYVAAWNNLENKYYLVIEEINRGNCAQIFGDLFQLLDRDKETGFSEYPIKADKDLKDYLEKPSEDGPLKNKDGIKDGKLKLPPNLNIIATMNTSDQSLFPMDSAFKRRWNWEYVPIKYEGVESSEYKINIPNSSYIKWVDFLKKINKIILEKTDSEDKQMGNFFIKGNIDEKDFNDKVMFYLWSEICKDLFHTNDNFFRTKEREFSYNELYEEDGPDLLLGFFEYIKEYKTKDEKKE